MNFETAVNFILQFEGGYVNNPKDPGGETNFGLSKRAFPNLDIKGLSREQAVAVYRREYWDKGKVEALPEALRLAVFDACVHAGPVAATKMLQKVLGVATDGKLGPETLKKVQEKPAKETLVDFLALRLNNLQGLEHYDTFANGWEKRLFKVAVYST